MSDRIVNFEMRNWNFDDWQKRFAEHLRQTNVQVAIHQIYLDMTTKYVPFKTGALTWSGRVLKSPVRVQWGYNTRKPNYAIFPYLGIANNGKPMRFNKTVHPGARSHWDLAVKKYEMPKFTKEVTLRLTRMAREEGW